MSLRLLAWVVVWEWVMSSEFETGINHIVSANSKILTESKQRHEKETKTLALVE